MIHLTDINKHFGTGPRSITAVDGVSLEIAEGEIFGIIGYSGAGKSTLIRLLNGLEMPTSGSITIGDLEISSISGKELREARQKVSMIFQHFNLLWSRTVKENITFPLEIAGVPKEERERKVAELIELVGLSVVKMHILPNYLVVKSSVSVLPGRLQMIQKYYFVMKQHQHLIQKRQIQFWIYLLDINERLGLTIVLITHEMHVIRKICHRVAVMEEGKVVEMGNVLDVFQSPKEPITKRFVSQVTEPVEAKQAIAHIKEEFPSGKLIKLSICRRADRAAGSCKSHSKI